MTNDDPQSGGVLITSRDIYDQLTELKYAVNELVYRLERSQEANTDHEGRIRDLEKWKYAISASLLSAVCALVIQLVQIFRPG
ncbi:hypothetical protein ACIBG8_19640 [Nonomuraea sp. NPDC050556]|uniref:hypothetical protein n=1 Tax=Nonomuraea sp. NPDC050556 TaxID=3364369 RepID=UPI0037B8C165